MSADNEIHYDPSVTFRAIGVRMAVAAAVLLVAMSLYHIYAAGFGLVRELVHRSIHLSFVLGLVFMLFPMKKSHAGQLQRGFLHYHGVPVWDVLLGVLAVAAVCYLPLLSPEVLAQRVGNPGGADILMGSLLILLVLEATRRAVGVSLMIICLIFIAYALWGQVAPGVLKHSGSSWLGLVNHLYLTNQGVYGIAVGVVAKYVFLFVLFGVLATEIGLGQLFIDLAQSLAGRYAGGPAKVAIFSSAMLGTISGSSIANTVTTGSLTIPAMKRVGYPPHFAGAVEATASTGGQITPPIMGAAAFIMVEFLQLPYRDILLAALFPALLHYFGIFTMVHLEAKRLGLRGLRRDELPMLMQVLHRYWLTLLPMVFLIALILTGRTPDFAAVWAIVLCVIVGFINPHHRLTFNRLWHAVALGAKYALAVGAAAAAVGIIVGVVTLTGTGFRLSFMITQGALSIAEWVSAGFFGNFLTIGSVTLFMTLFFTAIACVIMGAGIPTTATYIILASIAAPALGILNIEPIVAHFFVFYYGVLADITPPVALAAYAGAGIAGANPFKTGNTAFRLGIAKALVPFVFVYSPSLLLVTADFLLSAFFITLSGAVVGIGLLGCAFSGYAVTHLKNYQRWWLALAALISVSPGILGVLFGVAISAPVFIMQIYQLRLQKKSAGGQI